MEEYRLTLPLAADATIALGSPRRNYGSTTTLEADKKPTKHILMRFQVRGVNGRPVSSARLRWYNLNPSAIGGDFLVSDPNWDERLVTWNTAPAYNTTNSIATLGAVSSKRWYEVELKSLITSDGDYNVRVISSSGDGAGYASREDQLHAPQLIVKNEAGAPPPPPPPPGPGAAFVGSNIATESGGDVALSRPSGVAEGDLLVFFLAEHRPGSATPPAGTTLIRNDEDPSDLRLRAWYRIAGLSEPSTYTFSGVSDDMANAALLAYRGVDKSNPIEAHAGMVTSASITQITGPSMDVSVSNTMLVMGATIEGPTPNGITEPSGHTERAERAVHPTLEISDAIFASTGPTGVRVATADVGANNIGTIVALRTAP
ncbi:MAG: DUF7594 domain-containing protein [Actinomycetota bacterium]